VGGKMKFILVRHGQTDFNIHRRFGGHTDVPLNDTGIKQAEMASKKLKTEEIDKAYCSDLSRAKKTAEAIMHHHDLPLKYSDSIREMNFGSWEGLTYDEILKNYPAESEAWVRDYTNVPSLDGESLATFYDRIGVAFERIKSEVESHDTVLIVAHSGVIKSILCRELIGSVDSFWKFKVDNGGIAILEYDHDFPILTALNM